MKLPPAFLLFPLFLLFLSGCDSHQAESPLHATRYSRILPAAEKEGGGAEELSAAHTVDLKMSAAIPSAPVASGRLIIQTASLSCEVGNFEETARRLRALVEESGGYLVSSETRSDEDGRQSGTLVLRVPADKFETTLAALKRLVKKVENENISGNDVTEEFYDLSARLNNKRRAEQRFLEILKTAVKTTEILEVEQALANVREEIERLEGRQRYLSDQVALSTITVFWHEPRPLITTGRDSFWGKLKRGFENGLAGFGDVLSGTITFVIAVLPLVPVFWLAGWGMRKWYRRFRGHPPAAAGK
ncbi:MAG: DUF4349 domain-containing protein [candidate division KSB1 bacterium]|nr:DUF4349 domain-containing protein [candidate division KSB1 bacterium]MDZ7272998.1 DUF4349 domain-containing protein [candidate division KSB1 bacterium]MDZ7285101.1 DUF4349 domain-containing protein [candidate division KSB1 bacterium]MDZ7298133.1 DUF4349 domain-containing protein [candidate division KSB1 bacterium]MDZ7309350.1 DUF4349 domain-containing protein [candidate division KSB1 bacterium]